MSDPAKQWNYLVGSALEAARDGNLDDAEARVRRALALDPAPTVSDRELGEVWMQLGVVLTRKKQFAEAEAPLRRALALVGEAGPADELVGSVLELLGSVRGMCDDHNEAIALLSKALQGCAAAGTARWLRIVTQLDVCELAAKRPASAHYWAGQIHKHWVGACGAASPEAQKAAVRVEKLIDTTLTWAKRDFDAAKQEYGDRDPRTSEALAAVGAAFSLSGDDALAITLYGKAARSLELALGFTHPRTTIAMLDWALHLVGARRDDEAEPLLHRLDQSLTEHDPQSALAAETTHTLALLWLRRRRFTETIAMLEARLPTFERARTPREIPELLSALAHAYVGAGQPASARMVFERELSLREALGGRPQATIQRLLGRLIELSVADGDAIKAADYRLKLKQRMA